jgi:uncharacterized protein YabE (DUF348 family)
LLGLGPARQGVRTVSGPEGSSTKGYTLGAAGVPGPSNLLAITVFFRATEPKIICRVSGRAEPVHLFLAAIRCGRRGWMLIGLLLAGALFASYTLNSLLAQKSITVMLGREVYRFSTEAGTVGAALNDAGIVIVPEDRVIPGLTAPLHDGDIITVQKAHTVTVGADGTVQLVRTQATHPLDVLSGQRIPVSSHDMIRVDEQTYSTAALQGRVWDDPFQTIFVLRGVKITIIDRNLTGEQMRTHYTTQTNVGRALDEAGVSLYLADRITPDLSTPVEAGMVVHIDRSVPITVIADGHILKTRAVGPTVGDALASLGLAPVDQDITIPPENNPLEPAITIQIVRVTEKIVIEVEPIPFPTRFRFGPELICEELSDIQAGTDGDVEIRLRVRYEDGVAAEREIVGERVIREPVPRVVGCSHHE